MNIARWQAAASRPVVRRASILEACVGMFSSAVHRIEPDGFPSLSGVALGKYVSLRLVPDTLAPKRLPQLWLSLVQRCDWNADPLVLTARPRGDDYVSLASRVAGTLDVPPWLPSDFLVKGNGDVLAALDARRSSVAESFSDPALKEVAFLRDRTSMLYRFAEGRRGRHLIFREAVFSDSLSTERLTYLLRMLQGFCAGAA